MIPGLHRLPQSQFRFDCCIKQRPGQGEGTSSGPDVVTRRGSVVVGTYARWGRLGFRTVKPALLRLPTTIETCLVALFGSVEVLSPSPSICGSQALDSRGA